jgi:CRISPR-associated protein Csc3
MTENSSTHVDAVEELPDSLFTAEPETGASEAGPPSNETTIDLDQILSNYLEMVDPQLIEQGWGFKTAKSVELGKKDQSMLNHIRNAVFFLHRLTKRANKAGLTDISQSKLRNLIALTVIHDYHKLREEDADPEKRFDIPKDEIADIVSELNLQAFATVDGDAPVIEDYHSCSIDHHDSPNANPDRVTTNWETEYRSLIRLADGMASAPTPSAATDDRLQQAFSRAFPQEEYELRHHRFDTITGILTNFINQSIAKTLEDAYDYSLLNIYANGCVYIAPTTADEIVVDKEYIDDVYQAVTTAIQNTHPKYETHHTIAETLSVASGKYSLSGSQFLYGGGENVIKAVVEQGLSGSTDDDPTDAGIDSIQFVSDVTGIEISETRHTYELARLIYTIQSELISHPANLDYTNDSITSIRLTGEVLGLSEEIINTLCEVSEDDREEMAAGGKWDIGYALAAKVTEAYGGPTALKNRQDELEDTIITNLHNLFIENDVVSEEPEVDAVFKQIEQSHSGFYTEELKAFIKEHLRIKSEDVIKQDTTTDTYDQYTRKSRGQICSISGYGATNDTNLTDMRATEGKTNVQVGYTTRKPIGTNKAEKRVIAIPYQVEQSLRGDVTTAQDSQQYYIHLAPDYFYTPELWNLYSRLISRFSTTSAVRISRLAEAVHNGETPKEYQNILNNLTYQNTDDNDEANGRSMLESRFTDYDTGNHFGSHVIGYHKGIGDDSTNDTQHQFFGVYLASVIAGFTGLRAYLSRSPVAATTPDEYDEFVKIGGFPQVKSFFGGDSIPLSELETILDTASALIKLGYAQQGESRNDNLFAKYLRLTREKTFPGSYLLKRVVQEEDTDPDEGSVAGFLIAYVKTLDAYDPNRVTITTNSPQMTANIDSQTPDDDSVESKITTLAELAFAAIRPKPGSTAPHRIERVFRESVDAVAKMQISGEVGTEDATNAVYGQLIKMIEREQSGIYPVNSEKTDVDGDFETRVKRYAEYFVEEILGKVADNNPSELKRVENDFANAFYGRTKILMNELQRTDDDANSASEDN